MDYFDINVHFEEDDGKIEGVDPDKYCMFDIMNDILALFLCHLPTHDDLSFSLYCDVPGSDDRMNIVSDEDLMEMFRMHTGMRNIDLFMGLDAAFKEGELGNPILPPLGIENEEVDDFNDMVDGIIVEAICEKNSEDVDLLGCQNEKKTTANDIVGYSKVGNVGNCTGDQLSDYDSNGLEGAASDSDSSMDVVNVSMSRKLMRRKTKTPDNCMLGKEFQKGVNKIELEKGLCFENVHKFRDVLRDFTIQEGFKLVRVKNEKARVTCHCAVKGCPWRIHASPMSDGITFQIKTYNGLHTCISLRKNKEATSTWIAKKMMSRFKEDPNISINSLYKAVNTSFGIESSHMQLYRAKRKAREVVEGNHARSYQLLGQYANEIRKSNPGSLVKFKLHRIDVSSNPIFQRIFISFEAMKIGFKLGCRHFIGVDGCHLKGPYGGVLLSAVALDGNDGLFPLAFAVVESENRDSWSFFLTALHTVIGTHADGKPLTIISDMQKGLDSAMDEVLPEAYHRFCCRHLFSNFKKKFSGILLKKLFWKAARAYDAVEFNETMNQLQAISSTAYNWLVKFEVHKWARHSYDVRLKIDHITNNLSESFNSWVGDLRNMPIVNLLDGIRLKLMERIQLRLENGWTWEGHVTTNIKKKLNKAVEASRRRQIIFCGGDEFDVREESSVFVVDLKANTCSCKVWQITGIPCKHAVGAIAYRRADVELYCDPYLCKETYLKSYSGIIHPIVDKKLWTPVSSDPIQPPHLRRLPGRPRKNRRRDIDEHAASTSQVRRSSTVRCKNCGKFGHNSRTCQRAPVKNKKKNKVQTSACGDGVAYGQSAIATETSQMVDEVATFGVDLPIQQSQIASGGVDVATSSVGSMSNTYRDSTDRFDEAGGEKQRNGLSRGGDRANTNSDFVNSSISGGQTNSSTTINTLIGGTVSGNSDG